MENIPQWHQYTSDTGVIHILEIPLTNDACGIEIIDNNLVFTDLLYGEHPELITPLPEGDWELIGIHGDITEQNAARIMPVYKNGHDEKGFPYFNANGVDDEINVAFVKATTSLQTMIVNLFHMYQKGNGDFVVLFDHL